jgi:hypothetical protein
VPAWLASGPDPERVRAMLVRALDRPRRGGAFSRALAAHLGTDLDQVYAESYQAWCDDDELPDELRAHSAVNPLD